MNIKDRKESYKEIISANKGIDFFEKTKLRQSAFPGEFDNELQYRLMQAGSQTQQYMYIATDADHEHHVQYAKEYVSRFDCDINKVGEHFRQIELDKYAIERKAIIAECHEKGKKKAQHFKESLLDPTHANHVDNIAIFKTKYKEIDTQIESDFIEELLNKKGYKSVPVRDMAYEKTLMAYVSQLNPYQLASYKSLKELFELKWKAVGTVADGAIFQQFQNENVSIPDLHFKPKH